MDDNARPHRAVLIKDFLESDRIARIEWQVNWPDRNPIAKIFGMFSDVLCVHCIRVLPPVNLSELQTALQEE